MTDLERFQPVAARLLDSGLVNDPWYEGVPRFVTEPLVLSAPRLQRLHEATETALRLHDEAVQLVWNHPELVQFLGLTPVQELIWRAGGPAWHGYARADVFELVDGSIAVCEVNSDTPTGHAEAIAINRAVEVPRALDPNGELGATMEALFRHALRDLPEGAPRTAAIVYPTEMAEDLGVVLLFQRWLEAVGLEVVLGSPFNLGIDETGQPTLLGEPFGFLLRHYKTDWWSERTPVWDDEEPFEDSSPLARELHLVLRAAATGRIVLINPFGSVVSQNKRLLALMWEEMDRFSDESQADIARLIPETYRLESLHPEQIAAERDHWVLKSDYGCEGDEVVIGSQCTDAVWHRSIELASEGHWIVQRRFEPALQDDGSDLNFGVFAVAGKPTGCYVRSQRGRTDYTATTHPCQMEG